MADLKCPNCGAAGVAGAGGKTVCPQCGGSFTFEAGEAHLAGVAEFDQLKGKVEKLEAENAELRKLLPPAESGKPNGETDPHEDAEADGDDPDDEEF